jgi:hypothetical protein
VELKAFARLYKKPLDYFVWRKLLLLPKIRSKLMPH